jgi:hypothetical protein
MQGEKIALLALTGQRIYSWVLPYIRAVATESPELNIVPMLSLAVPEDEDELMLRAVEGSQPSLVFRPNTEVEKNIVDTLTGSEDLSCVSPVHARKMHATRFAVPREKLEAAPKEVKELLFRHFAYGHLELAMVNRSVSAGMTVDGYVVWRIYEDCIRLHLSH